MVLGCYISSARGILQSLWPFFLTGLTYDAMKYITPVVHQYNPPHVEGPYNVEKFLFGIDAGDGREVIPSEYLMSAYSSTIDLPCAFAYFFFLYESFALGFYLLATD